MRIGMVTTQFAEVGGVENVVRSLTEEMKEEHEVVLITRERSQNAEEFPVFDEIIEVPDTESFSDYLKNGRKWFKEHADDFDILHFHNWTPIITASGIEAPRVLTFHGTTLDVALGNNNYLKAPMYWMFEQYAISVADKLTSITESHLKPFRADNYEIIRNGVNTEKYQPPESKEEKQKLREKHRVRGKGVLIVAQHEPNKGHKNLIKAASKLNQEHTLMIPSAGPLREELEELAERDVNAEFYGKVPEEELIELYQAADIFCLPSWNEGLPLSMLEALSSGLPILVSDVADNKKIVEESESGITVRPKDVKDLEERLEKMLDEPLEEKISNARKYAEEELDWRNVADKYIEIYREVKE